MWSTFVLDINREAPMANLHLVLLALFGIFGTFAGAVAYVEFTTRDLLPKQ
ncbi:MAG TPA: hypothetical protein VGN79_07655 [Devosia sp.]|nr:hypothetical protein [Devosia sp.]